MISNINKSEVPKLETEIVELRGRLKELVDRRLQRVHSDSARTTTITPTPVDCTPSDRVFISEKYFMQQCENLRCTPYLEFLMDVSVDQEEERKNECLRSHGTDSLGFN